VISRKTETLKGNSILIITEKPQAAAKIAAALSNGRDKKHSDNGIPYYEFDRKGNNMIVACAVGHLFSLSQDVKGSGYPIFEVSWKPNFEVRKKDFTKKYYSNLLHLVKRAREIIVATDYDIEGEVIGYNIIRFIAKQKDAKRMKFSSLTAGELEQAFTQVHETIDWGQAIAGETRHYIDWYYGINLSRALMNSIKSTGKFRVMSIGRVQGPALKMIVDKEREISKFISKPFWKIYIDVTEKANKKNKATLKYIKDIFDEKELAKFELKNKEIKVKTEKHSQSIEPPHPFDLTSLQTEAYRLFGLNPARTLAIAQQLYLDGLISYPRTSSQKIPEAINPRGIIQRLSDYFKQANLCTRAKPTEGKKSDPAHPSISPTGEFRDLEGELRKIYELIVKRFLACFAENAIVENKTLTGEIESLVFKDRGVGIHKKGWMEIYPSTMKERGIEDMNGPANIDEVNIEKDETKPPRRFSPASIISELEKAGLGTKATRANILETLYDRNYIEDQKSIKATPLGINLIETLEKHSPIIIDQKLTKDMEKDMEGIRESKKELEQKQTQVLDKAKHALIKISEDFHKKENAIGNDLNKATQIYYKQQAQENEIMPCPVCKKGNLGIKYSPKNRKYFIACNAYPDCKTTFSLPPYGLIKKLGNDAEGNQKKCEKCGFPLLMSLQKGKRPWIFCFNPNCETRKQKQIQNQEESEEQSETKTE
jgi:DNA topoisomerase-1